MTQLALLNSSYEHNSTQQVGPINGDMELRINPENSSKYEFLDE